MNRKVYPYMGCFAYGLIFIVIAAVMGYVWYCAVLPGKAFFGDGIYYAILIPFSQSLSAFLLIWAYVFFRTAQPVRATEDGLVSGWFIKETLRWDEVSAMGFANGSEVPNKVELSGSPIVSSIDRHYTGQVYMYFLCEEEPLFEHHMQKFEILDLYMFYVSRRNVLCWIVRKLIWVNVLINSDIMLNEKKLPRRMVLLPLYDDIYAYAKKKVAEAQEAKNAEA